MFWAPEAGLAPARARVSSQSEESSDFAGYFAGVLLLAWDSAGSQSEGAASMVFPESEAHRGVLAGARQGLAWVLARRVGA